MAAAAVQKAAAAVQKAADAAQKAADTLQMYFQEFWRTVCMHSADSLQSFLKAFCRLFADNLHAVQTLHRLIVIRT